MPIEATLERIAVALEAIANSKALPAAAEAKPTRAEAPKTEAPKTRPGKKVEEKVGEKVETIEEDFTSEETAQETTDLDIKWPDVNKKLFGMLNRVRDEIGPDEAKAICASLMKKYSGGQKFGPGTVAPKSYKALLEEIEIELEALGG